MANTVRDLIKSSLKLIGAKGPGDAISADEQADALYVLNEMIDSWKTERLMVPVGTRLEFTLVPGQSVYTIGPTGDFNTTRPMNIENAAIIDESGSPALEIPMDILNKDQWAAIITKQMQGTYPSKLFFLASMPLGQIYIWPAPTEAKKMVIYPLNGLSEFAGVNDLLSNLLPGMRKALRYNLGLELCPEYGIEPSLLLIKGADEGKDAVKRSNNKPVLMSANAGIGGGKQFDINTGD